jgi:hypothetical protein
MSAFLGPIHHWLYNKILWHEHLLEDIYALMPNDGIDIKMESESAFGGPEKGALEAVIDGGNIHGWLQTKIQSLEYRMAYAITKGINRKSITFKQLSSLYHQDGEKAAAHYQGPLDTPQDVFKALFDYLLEGMPCDRVNQPMTQDETSLTWAKRLCIHTEFWQTVEGDVEIFDALRLAWYKGFTGDEFSIEKSADNQFKVMRRSA